MSQTKSLVVEILSGPLDGATLTLTGETEWSCTGDGLLAFPWDAELGQPQARFTIEEEGCWWLEGLPADHGTYRVNRDEKIKEKVQLKPADLLKASDTWLLVHQVDQKLQLEQEEVEHKQ